MFHLPWSKPVVAGPVCLPEVPADAAPETGCSDSETASMGCGWFDSSHDLLQGLQVQEHTQPEALADILPLSAWRTQPRPQLALA